MEDNRSIVERYVAALPADLDTLTSLQHPDFVEEWPQSGERIVGSENFRAIQEHYPDVTGEVLRLVGTEDRWTVAPTFTPLRIVGAGDTFTALARARYPDGSEYHVVSVLEVRDGRIARATTFFAERFEPPDWRARWVERVPGPKGPD
ncbi:MAG: nuclear transport factor 2 family protein [Actinomycetota bacterium]|nr:nuclear transport factor 2 family protein [Actinomycetota bacterium]